MVIQIDFEALIKVMLDELERQHPNGVMPTLQGTAGIMKESISENPKGWFTTLGLGILAIDGKDY